jgi:hypothetical protein
MERQPKIYGFGAIDAGLAPALLLESRVMSTTPGMDFQSGESSRIFSQLVQSGP